MGLPKSSKDKEKVEGELGKISFVQSEGGVGEANMQQPEISGLHHD